MADIAEPLIGDPLSSPGDRREYRNSIVLMHLLIQARVASVQENHLYRVTGDLKHIQQFFDRASFPHIHETRIPTAVSGE